MHKLLSADFSRLRKSKIFWACMGAMLIYSIVYMLSECISAEALADYSYDIDSYYFHFTITIGGFCALFSSMFLGTEYSDGTMRNKIIVGHTRVNIYMANLVTVFVVTLMLMCVWLLGPLIAMPFFGVWTMGITSLMGYLMIAVLFEAAFAAIFTFICMQSSNKAMTIVISLLLFLGMLVAVGMINSALSEPETVNGILMTKDGMQMSDPEPNPNYVSGMTRKIYEFINDFLPTGQGIQLWQLQMGNTVRMAVSSIVITVVTTLSGILIFRKKDLK